MSRIELAGESPTTRICFATRCPVVRTPCGENRGPATATPGFVTCAGCRRWLAARAALGR